MRLQYRAKDIANIRMNLILSETETIIWLHFARQSQ